MTPRPLPVGPVPAVRPGQSPARGLLSEMMARASTSVRVLLAGYLLGTLSLAVAGLFHLGNLQTRQLATNSAFVGSSGLLLASALVRLRQRHQTTAARDVSFTLAAAGWFAGNCAWFYYQEFAAGSPYPGLNDAGYLLALAAMTATILLSQRGLLSARARARDLVDASLASVGLLTLAWIAYLAEGLHSAGGMSPLGRLVLLSYPVLDILLLVLAGLTVRRLRRNEPGLTLIAVATAFYVAADLAWNVLAVNGGYTPGNTPVDSFWVLAYGLLALVPWVWSRGGVQVAPPRQPPMWATLAPTLAALLSVMTVLAVTRTRLGALELCLIGAVIGLSLTRQVLLISDLRHLAETLEEQVHDRTAQLAASRDKLRHEATHDGLTGLANRRLLAAHLERATSSTGSETALALLDLDDFKAVNDGLGHGAGDALLVVIAARLRAATRSQDVVARLGGDEFAVHMKELTSAQAEAAVRQILASVAQPVVVAAGHLVHPSVSIGLVVATPSVRPAEVLARADVAMYAAKRSGKGQYAVYDPRVHTALDGLAA